MPLNSPQILDREFLEVRAKILEIAASFDRIDRADGTVEGDPRAATLQQALNILSSDAPNRAEQLQLLFSRDYEENWRDTYGLSTSAES